jgi:hypothetical protein
MSDEGESDLDADRCAVLPEQLAGELATVVGDYAVRHTEAAHQPRMNLTDDLAGIVRASSTSAHLVNLSTVM